MLIKIVIPIFSFFAVFFLHMLVSIWGSVSSITNLDPSAEINYLPLYFSTVEQYPGLSMAIAAAFISYAILKFIKREDNQTKSIITGVVIAFFVFLILTFSTGYFGSSIENVYIEKMGSLYIPIKRRVIILITIISVLAGFIHIKRKTRKIKSTVT